MPKALLNRLAQLALAIAVLTLLAVGAISYRGLTLAAESESWVQHTYEVLEGLQGILATTQGIESSARGFALTGGESFLSSFQDGVSRFKQDEADLRRLVADNPEQQRLLATVATLVDQKVQFGEQVIDLRRTGGVESAAAAIETRVGQHLMREIERAVGTLRSEEWRLLALRNVEAKQRLRQAQVVLILGDLMGLLVVVGAFVSVQRDSSRRRAIEEELRESEEKYRMLFDGVRDYAIFMMDPKGDVLSWNAGAERTKGYSAGEILGRNFACFFPPDDVRRGRPEELLRMTAASGRQEEQALRVRRDGSQFLAHVTLAALHDRAGRLRGFSEISHDLSESKESEARYRGLLEAAPDAMVVVNTGGEIVLLNVQAEKQFGYRRDELVGQPVKRLIPEGFAERLIADGTRTAAEALAQQIGTGIELIGRRKNGSAFPIEIMLSPLEGVEGILVTAAIRDISVRKAAEAHLAQMEGRYRGLLEAAPDAMVVVNTGGGIVLLNVQAEKQFGYHRNELVGQKVRNIIPEGFAERLVADALRSAEAALAQQIGTGIELSGRRKDGTEFPIEIMLSPLEGAEGILVTAAIRDISRRKAAEAQLLQKVEELKRSNEELGQFAYIASHDLQEPLRMVASYTQLLSRRYKGKLDSDADEFIAFAVDGASRMQRLIQDLLTFSRVGTKGKDLVETASERSLEQALVNLRGAIEESGALVTHDPLPAVLADEAQLVQLFQNLVGNAIKYQGPGVPRVHISAARNGDRRWVFSVRDNGLGIDPQYFERIFGMFQRLHKREEFAGTGIGLAICKKIAERHGSSITVQSQPGQGSTFLFSLSGSEIEPEMPIEEETCA